MTELGNPDGLPPPKWYAKSVHSGPPSCLCGLPCVHISLHYTARSASASSSSLSVSCTEPRTISPRCCLILPSSIWTILPSCALLVLMVVPPSLVSVIANLIYQMRNHLLEIAKNIVRYPRSSSYQANMAKPEWSRFRKVKIQEGC